MSIKETVLYAVLHDAATMEWFTTGPESAKGPVANGLFFSDMLDEHDAGMARTRWTITETGRELLRIIEEAT